MEIDEMIIRLMVGEKLNMKLNDFDELRMVLQDDESIDVYKTPYPHFKVNITFADYLTHRRDYIINQLKG